MSLLKILKESFEMLVKRPQLFVPRIFSAALSSLALIGWITGYIGTINLLAFFPLITVIGAFTPVMVSSMVRNDGKNLLERGFKESLELWRPILGFTFLTIFLGFLTAIPSWIGFAAFYITGEIFFLALGVLLSFLLVAAIGFVFYFVPITILEEGNLFSSLKGSIHTSGKNGKDVMALTLFSLAVLGASSLATGQLRDFGLSVFFLGRMFSSIVGTYLIVVSPKYYLEEKHGS